MSALPKNTHKIANRTDAENQLAQVAHLTGLLHCAVATRDQEILTIQERHAALIQNISKEIEVRKALLEAWALEHRAEEFGESKTLKMPDGKLFFRQGQRKLSLLPEWSWDTCLSKLLSFDEVSQWSEYIRREPEIDKAKLLKDSGGEQPYLPPARLKTIGLEVTREERFDLEVRPGPGVFDVLH